MNLREQLENPEVFRINRMDAHSDHTFIPEEKGKKAKSFIQSLDGVWKFIRSERIEDRPLRFYEENYDLSRFKEIRVPGHMELQGYGVPQYINTLYPWDGVEGLRPPQIPKDSTPVGSYVCTFDAERGVKNGEAFLSFQGVEVAFSVWLNGTYVGYSEDSFTPSEFCVTELLRKKDNRLAVEVYKRASASWMEDQDFWRFSGIFRSVNLVITPKTHIYDLAVTSDYNYADGVLSDEMKQGAGFLTVSAKVMADTKPKKKDVVLSLSTPDGELIHFAPEQLTELSADDMEEIEPLTLTEEDRGVSAYPVTLTPRTKRLFLFTWRVTLPGVLPWSAEEPNLYELNLRIPGKEKVIQQVGFRTFELKDGLMCLNGKRIIFRGVNRHEFSLTGGRVVSLSEMEEDIRIIKENNMNAVRTCHYPNRSEWYGLCDLAGIYLIDETNLETHGSWQKLGKVEPSWNIPGDLPEWKEAVLDRAKSMYERDKNHPSVLIWSLGNESYAGEDFAAMSEYFHGADSRRLVHYEGVFHNPKYRYISDMESRMYAKPAEIEEYLEGELAKKAADPSYVTKPYISCEYMHAMGNSLGGMQLYTDLEDRYPGYQGGFIWDYIDQVLPKKSGKEVLLGVGGDFGDRPTDYGFCTNGIVYGDRSISPKMQEVRALYSPLRIDVDEEKVQVENRNLFSDTSDILFTVSSYLNGELLEKKPLMILVAPGETAEIPHGMTLPSGEGVAWLTVRAFRKDAYLAEMNGKGAAGKRAEEEESAEDWYCFAFGQCVREQGKKEPLGNAEPSGIVPGDGYIGLIGKNNRIQFSMAEGGISSIRIRKKEICDRIPRISFWRAMTDNDCGAGYPGLMAPWYAAGHFARKAYEDWKVLPMENGLKMITAFRAGMQGEIYYTVTYSAFVDGRVLVEAEFPGVSGYPVLPTFAMDFCVDSSLTYVNYMGMGPDENYIDRKCGAEFGCFSYKVKENLSEYLKPQECGNRTGVREFTVLDKNGAGLRFTAAEEPVEFSVLPYSAYELEEAGKREELPVSRHTWIRIAAAQMGVGGDDSWGAPVHDEYLLSPETPRKLAFWITEIS